MHSYDVIIVGAGPAGSALAAHLARQGVGALLLDKSRFPRDKVCGEMLNARAMRSLDGLGCLDEIEALGYTKIHGCTVTLNDEIASQGRMPQLPGCKDYAYAIPRLVLDEIIFRQARRLGAKALEDCRVLGFRAGPRGLVVEALHDGEQITLECRMVVGADGAESTVARIADLAMRDERYTGVAMRSYGEGYPFDDAVLYFDRDFFPGLGWAFPSRDGRFNIGVGMMAETVKRDRVKLRAFYDRILGRFEQTARRSGFEPRVDEPQGWALKNYGGARANFFERGLLIGDAGCFADPLTGEGIPVALETAELAAETIREAIATNDFSAASLESYEHRWRDRYDLDSLLADYIMTACRNPHLADLLMDSLRLLNRAADRDQKYAAIAAGVYTGVLPLREVLSLDFVMRPLLNGPRFWMDTLDVSSERPLADLMRQARKSLDQSMAAWRGLLSDSESSLAWWLELQEKQLRLLELMARQGTRSSATHPTS
jgi:geranylgeranyl reductase family protein